jgi:tRNA(Ile)-lysidine synthase
MKTLLQKRVLKTIHEGRMLAPGDRVGVAVSGGADSVALLRLLEDLREDLGITLLVVHFNHTLRGDESEGDASFVRDLARGRGLELNAVRKDVAAEAKRNGWNLEDAARRLRYSFFRRVVAEGRATRIAVAHTLDDQAETLLSHLVRGTGPTGLAGIYPIAGSIVRPLIEVRRQDLREYLSGIGQSWREDSMNRDLHRLRARIRTQLLPVLERDYSLHIVSHLGELARLSREEELFWSALVEDRFRTWVKGSDGDLTIHIQDLLAPLDLLTGVASLDAEDESPARSRPLTERLIRRLYEALRGNRRDLSAKHVQHVIHLATASTSGQRVELPGGIQVERSFDDLVFSCAASATGSQRARETSTHQNAYQYVVTLPKRGTTTVSVPELGSCFSLKVIDWPMTASETKRDSVALDADLLRAPLVLRNWRPGDAYRPCGRQQARKLKRLLLAGRIPSRQRARWPVLESGGLVIWARGVPPAEEICANERTRAAVLIDEDPL